MIGLLLSPLGRWLGGAAIILTLLGGIYLKGRSDGKAVVMESWRNAAAADRKNADRAVKDADALVPALTEAQRESDRRIAPHSEPCIVYSPWDRDCGPDDKAGR